MPHPWEAPNVFFEAGEQQTVEDMIKCIIIASGNDAAVAMAEFTSGSEELFVSKMNERAKELGMQNTNFVNACGLDADGHVTSSRDIAIMSRELITKHPDILNYSNIWMDSIIHKTARGESRFDLANTNKFFKSLYRSDRTENRIYSDSKILYVGNCIQKWN